MTTLPRRFVLDTAAIAGALTMAKVQPPAGSSLPAPGKPNKKALQRAEVLEDGALHPSLATALRVIAAPGRVLRVWANGAGRTAWVETRLMTDPDAVDVIACAEHDGEYDLAMLGSRRQAVLLIDQLLGLTDLIAGESEGSYDLSLEGYVALLASADRLQEATLTNRLERTMRRPPPTLDTERLTALVDLGLKNPDTRWAISAAAIPSPVGLALNAGQIAHGVVALQNVGLAEGTDDGPVLTGEGFQVASALTQIVGTSSLSLTITKDGDASTVAPITLFRCATAIWAALWHGASDDQALTLAELNHNAALGIIEDLLSDLQASESGASMVATQNGETETEIGHFCSDCGTALRPGDKYCTVCGKSRR